MSKTASSSRMDTDLWCDIALAALPFLIAFVAVPLAIYLPNQIEFEFNRVTMVSVAAIGGLFFLILAVFVFSARNRKWRASFAHAFFFWGVFMLLVDILAPMQWGLLDGESKLTEPTHLTIIEVGLLAVLIICWVKVPNSLVRTFGVPLVLVIAILQPVYFVGASSEPAGSRPPQNNTGSAASAGNFGGHEGIKGNIYHVVFDAYSSAIFTESLQKLRLMDEFNGFTFFVNNLSNYQRTDESVPSFMTGEFFKGGSFKEFQLKAKTGGLRRNLQDAGYRISLYIPNRARFWMYDGASHTHTSEDTAKKQFLGADVLLLAQVSLVRVTLNSLRKEVFSWTDAFFNRVTAFANGLSTEEFSKIKRHGFYLLSVPLIRRFIEEERGRSEKGNYVFAHLMLPHSPHVWDNNCQYRATTNYEEQALCATRLMAEIIGELKRLGRYESSLIIFQSDHGVNTYGRGLGPVIDPSFTIKEKIESGDRYNATEYIRRIQSLLLIKPPSGEGARLQISRVPSALVDVPATIYDVLKIDAHPGDGKSVFSLLESEPREIHLFSGTYTRDQQGRARTLGQSLSETTLVHVSYTAGIGWRIYPDVPAFHEGW